MPRTAERPATYDFERFPRTRYQGSKRKLAAAIENQLRSLDFRTALDAFGGTGAVAYALKCAGKHVTYNDLLAFNHRIGLALIENDSVRLDEDDVAAVCGSHPDIAHDDFIERTFEGIYFTTEENQWLDAAVANIRSLTCRFKRAIAWFALFQAAMAKRPYNLFHRRNLYMRTADVTRSFGNKASWDRSFPDHFRRFVREANAAVIDGAGSCSATNRDVLDVPGAFDLVYVDTPYISGRGVGVDYQDFYHFLEGLVRYDEWPALVDHDSKHRRMSRRPNPWTEPERITAMFERLFDRYKESILVVSYRSDGIPSIDRLVELLQHVKRDVRAIDGPSYQYALSTNRISRETLLIGT